jgi:putative flippase GtrA
MTDSVDTVLGVCEPVGPGTRGWRQHLSRLWRYATVSLASSVISIIVLGLLVGVFAAPDVWANVTATLVSTVPAFELNRRWTWQKTGERSFMAEVLPFYAMSFAGLVLSSIMVHFVGHATIGWSRLTHTEADEGANLGSFFLLWLVQYCLLDRWCFVREPAIQTSTV